MRYGMRFDNDIVAIEFSDRLMSKDLLIAKETLCKMIDNRIEDIKKLEVKELTTEDSIRSIYPPLTGRTQNVLLRAGYETIGDVLNCTITDLTRVRNMGGKSLEEVKERFSKYGSFKEGSNNE